jgi:hypothetical protein
MGAAVSGCGGQQLEQPRHHAAARSRPRPRLRRRGEHTSGAVRCQVNIDDRQAPAPSPSPVAVAAAAADTVGPGTSVPGNSEPPLVNPSRGHLNPFILLLNPSSLPANPPPYSEISTETAAGGCLCWSKVILLRAWRSVQTQAFT